MKKALSITNDQAIELGEIFRLLGDPSRLKIVIACFPKPICVSDVAARTKLSASLVSHHLRLLRAARLVRAERQGKQVFYTAADDPIRRVLVDMVAHIGEPDGD